MRAFLAIEIEPYIKNKIEESQEIISESESSNIKYVERENIHLTLKFFGEIDDEKLDEISAIIRQSIKSYDKKIQYKILFL